MSVEDWAERERDKTWAWEEPAGTAFRDGIVHAFSALLSDEAVIASAKRISGYFPGHEVTFDFARAALQAAITAVTEGDAVTIEVPADIAKQMSRKDVGGFSITEGEKP